MPEANASRIKKIVPFYSEEENMAKKPDGQRISSPQDFLREVFQRYADDIPYHPWVNEHNRWLELISCILLSYREESGQNARRAVNMLEELGLLDVEQLSKLPWKDGSPDLTDRHSKITKEILYRMNFTEPDFSQIPAIILSLAQEVEQRYNDRIQIYLRKHGERMLSDLPKDFQCFSSKDEKLQRAFTIWIQNVLTMPVPLETPALDRFCKEAGCTKNELFLAADQINLSASIVDDLIDLWDEEDKQYYRKADTMTRQNIIYLLSDNTDTRNINRPKNIYL